MNKIMSKILSQFRGGCIHRGNLIKFNNISRQIEYDLKFEDLITERQQLQSLTRMLSRKVKGLEVMVCDLTRAIKRMEFDKQMDLEMKTKAKKPPAEQPIEGGGATSPPAASEKKKSPNVGDFSGCKNPPKCFTVSTITNGTSLKPIKALNPRLRLSFRKQKITKQ